MQRQIKFRGKTLDTNTWVYGDLITKKPSAKFRSDCVIFDDSWHSVNPSTIGQFTGLKDINGKEIYEGDILRYCPNHGAPVTAPVEWIGTSFQFVVDKESRLSATLFGFRPSMFMEIIGNRWGNPELLKGGDHAD